MSDQSKRTITLRRALASIDQGSSPGTMMRAHIERQLAVTYDAGHIDGSGVRYQTEREVDLCHAVRALSDYQVVCIGEHISPQLKELIDSVREA